MLGNTEVSARRFGRSAQRRLCCGRGGVGRAKKQKLENRRRRQGGTYRLIEDRGHHAHGAFLRGGKNSILGCRNSGVSGGEIGGGGDGKTGTRLESHVQDAWGHLSRQSRFRSNRFQKGSITVVEVVTTNTLEYRSGLAGVALGAHRGGGVPMFCVATEMQIPGSGGMNSSAGKASAGACEADSNV